MRDHRSWRGSVLPFVYDTDAQDYFDRVVAAGGTLGDTTKGHINTFILALKTALVWTSIVRMNLFCTDGFTGLEVPLVDGGIGLVDDIVGFTPPNYAQGVGLTSSGASRYVDTRCNPGTTPADRVISTYGMFASVKGIASNNQAKTIMGAVLGIYAADLRFGDGFLDNNFWNAGFADSGASVNVANSDGMYGVRLTATNYLATQGATEVDTTAFNVLGTVGTIYVGMRHAAVADRAFQGIIRGYVIVGNTTGIYFDADDVTALNAAMAAFQTSMGRV